jgi:methylase of polypeptide subunit release factors
MAAVNAALNGVDASSGSIEYVHGDLLDSVRGPIDLIIANPPYLADPGRRLYRDGGDIAGAIGGALSVRIVEESMRRLSPGGRLVLYTGSAIVAGEDLLYKAIAPFLTNCRFRYTEIDPDVFGEELDAATYASVERIAAVSLIATLLQGGSP